VLGVNSGEVHVGGAPMAPRKLHDIDVPKNTPVGAVLAVMSLQNGPVPEDTAATAAMTKSPVPTLKSSWFVIPSFGPLSKVTDGRPAMPLATTPG